MLFILSRAVAGRLRVRLAHVRALLRVAVVRDLREIWLAPDRATAQAAMTTFAEKYARKYTGALDCAENAPAE
jgi:transposase-like protein